MNKLFTFLAVVLLTANVFAQSPQKMSYQAVIRNSSNALVTSTAIGMRISILQGSGTGSEIFKEIYNPNPQTNANGLVTIDIGSGIPLTGSFASINWSNGLYFIKTETDPTGGTNYTIIGTSQLLSVPYALHSKTADSLTGSGVTYNIGDIYGGGIVFYVYDNGRHGLIAATTDQGTSMRWNAGTNTNTMARADGIGAGKSNTDIIIATQGYGDGATYAARLCKEYNVTVSGVTYGDWYLPSKFELYLLYLQRVAVGINTSNPAYCSSTEIDNSNIWGQSVSSGFQGNLLKSDNLTVRAIRAF